MKAREFGEYLKELRKKKKLTIRQLDTYSGVSNSYISQMERGERGVPSPEILQKLSKPLGVEYDELMILAGYSYKKNSADGARVESSEIDKIVSRIEEETGVSLRDDPVILNSIEQNLLTYAHLKKHRS